MQDHTKQQHTLVQIIPILHVTSYATQVNRQKLNEVMDAIQNVNEDVNTLFNITDILTQYLRYQEIYTYAHTILAYLRDSLTYMRQVAIQTMDYVDTDMTDILSPYYILPVEELRNMLRHIESQLPSIMDLLISLDDTLHFYWYFKIHILTADGQLFAQKFQIYEFLAYQSHTVTVQLSTKSTTNT